MITGRAKRKKGVLNGTKEKKKEKQSAMIFQQPKLL